MRLFPPFFPKSESKVLPRLAIEGRIVAFSLDTTVVLSHVKSVTERIHKILLRNLLHNSLQVTKFSPLICRSVYIAWCSLPSSIVGWSEVPTRFRTIWIFKVKCSCVTFLTADCRNVAFFTTHTSLFPISKPRFSVFAVVYYILLWGQFDVIRCLQISRCDHDPP